jgi:hypothetical protein
MVIITNTHSTIETLDAGVIAIVEPTSGTDLSATEIVIVKVKNFGNVSITEIPIMLEVDGVIVAAESVTSTIAPEAEVEFTFLTSINLSTEKTYMLKAYTMLEGDENPTNDTAMKTVTNTHSASIGNTLVRPNIVVYPNPASDILYIQSEDAIKRIEFFDAQGKIIKTILNHTQEIFINDLKAGAYMLKIQTGESVVTQRFVKQ